MIEAAFSGDSDFGPSSSGLYGKTVRLALPGYWLAPGTARSMGPGRPVLRGHRDLGGDGRLVGIAGTPTGKGYWVVTPTGR